MRSERGTILLLTAILMLVMLVVAAFATDVGAWYRQGQEQQRSADLGSLNGIQAYEGVRRDEFALHITAAGTSAQSWADIPSQTDRENIDHLALEAAVQAVIGMLEASGHPVTQGPSNPLYEHPTGIDPYPTDASGTPLPVPSSSVEITTDDGLTITITRTPDLTISVTIRQNANQYFSSMVSDAPEIERTSVATLSNCGAICDVPFTINPPFLGFSGAGSGDGFKPLLYPANNEVWAVNHHRIKDDVTPDPATGQSRGEIICMNQTTRTFCDDNGDGFIDNSSAVREGRYSLGTLETHNRPAEEYLDISTGKMYFVARNWATGETGLVCFNTNSKSYCGFDKVFDQNMRDSNWNAIVNATGPWVYQNELYVMGQNGTLECRRLDLSNCSGTYSWNTAGKTSGLLPELDPDEAVVGRIPTTFVNGERVGSRIYFTHILNGADGVVFHCWDLDAENSCGWPAVVHSTVLTGREDTRQTFLSYAGSTASGICVADIDMALHLCVSPSGTTNFTVPGLNTHLTNIADHPDHAGLWLGDTFTWQGDAGERRTFFAGGNSNKTACWDWSSGACGILDHDRPTDTAHRTYPYAYTLVSNDCIMGLGDQSVYFSFKPDSLTVCVDTTVSVDLAPCDCANSVDKRWGVIELPQELLDQVNSLEGTVRDAAGNPISPALTSVDLLASGGQLDLSGISPAVTYLELYLEVEAKLDANGVPSWVNPINSELHLVVQPTLTD